MSTRQDGPLLVGAVDQDTPGKIVPLLRNAAGELIVTSGGAAGADVNVISVGGASITLGQKTEAASLPVTIASDQSPLPVYTETSALYAGLTALTPKFAKIAAASSGVNALVTAVGGKKIRVLAYNFIANGTVNAKFQSDGAGTPVDLTGLKYCVANMGICAPANQFGWFESASGKSLDLNLSGATAVGGELVYVEV